MTPFMILLLTVLQILHAHPSQTTSLAPAVLRLNSATHTLWIDHKPSSGTTTILAASRDSPNPTPTAIDLSFLLHRQLSSTPPLAPNNCENWGMWQKVGLVAVVCLVIFPVVGLAIYTQQRKVADDRVLGEALRCLPGMPKEFRYADLSRATAEFSESNVLGKGGFGVVYRGKLPSGDRKEEEDEVSEVAVKTFSRDTSRGDFLAELTIINRLRHRNLVRLLGWCYKNKKLLLVYEYMPNGSLDRHLFCAIGEKPLAWERRYHVLDGVASALHYLHNDYHQKVIHRDLKASNIMLDAAFHARLGDFGLARAVDACGNTSYEELEGVPGTWGYIAPECFHTGKATGKSDVYAFGAVVLEVVCGRRPGAPTEGHRMLVDWVWAMYEAGKLLDVVDSMLGKCNYPQEEAERLLLLGLACSHPIASERPKTQTILQVLSKSIPPPTVPKKRPDFVLPSCRSANRVTGLTSSSVVVSGFTGIYCPPASPRTTDNELSNLTNYYTCNVKSTRHSFEGSDTSSMLQYSQSHRSSNGSRR